MKYSDIAQVLRRLGIQEFTEPNHAGWLHLSCPYAPFTHKNGHDQSQGFAVKVEDAGTSAYGCPACKRHGRLEKLARELGEFRGQDYSALIKDISRAEAVGAVMLPNWENRFDSKRTETLGEPLDLVAFDPEAIFDPVGDHQPAVDYLISRRVTPEGVKRAGIRYDPDKRRIVFPVYDGKGNLYGMTGRSIQTDQERTFWGVKDQKWITLPKVEDYAGLPKRMVILGEHRWQKGRATILVEGLIGYARFLSEGVDDYYNVGALLGSALTPGKASILKQWGNAVIPILDPDEAGDAGVFGPLEHVYNDRQTGEPIYRRDWASGIVGQMIDHVPVFVPGYPEGINDVDDLTCEMVVAMCTGLQPMMKTREIAASLKRQRK